MMVKMFGSMSAAELMEQVSVWRDELASQATADPRKAQVLIPKDTIVALMLELKASMNDRLFYELGRVLKLDESRAQAQVSVPQRHMESFRAGVRERELIENTKEKCNVCEYRVRSMRTHSGRIYFASSQQNKCKTEETE